MKTILSSLFGGLLGAVIFIVGYWIGGGEFVRGVALQSAYIGTILFLILGGVLAGLLSKMPKF